MTGLPLAQFTVLSWHQHYRRIGAHWYRDATARLLDGTVRTVSVREDVAA